MTAWIAVAGLAALMVIREFWWLRHIKAMQERCEFLKDQRDDLEELASSRAALDL